MHRRRTASPARVVWCVTAATTLWAGWGCARGGPGGEQPVSAAEDGGGRAAPAHEGAPRTAAAVEPGGDGAAGSGGRYEWPHGGSAEDWAIARERVVWARDASQGLTDFGELFAALGETFLGTAYVARTLEAPADQGLPEGLVVNLRQLDCVTFVENVLALARLARTDDGALLDDPDTFQRAFRDELMRIRYRGGRLDGYASRLHYFSEWLADNEAKGVLRQVTRELGGVEDGTDLDFMSTNPEAYAQLADENVLSRIVQIEAALASLERFYIPEDEIAASAHLIRTGDVIAATSTLAGLDVAHTGIAVWRDGTLRLLHAPLVGSSVTLSEESLAERIARIEGQDGIMVARPLDPSLRGEG